ncbi:hypothetical protein [Pseudomonas indica]|uniref:hypothetical protein n=1 Tax=Pseudomonas indica TaxID=137658 RepID=UPI003FD00AD3
MPITDLFKGGGKSGAFRGLSEVLAILFRDKRSLTEEAALGDLVTPRRAIPDARSSGSGVRSPHQDAVSGDTPRSNMVYVQRDADGHILRVEHEPFDEMTEVLAVESEELQRWITAKEEMKARLDALRSSDLDLIRVLEDVVSVLVVRGLISFTDLPEAARLKLDQRALARAEIEGLADVLGEEKDV